jgi:hypothetical protein
VQLEKSAFALGLYKYGKPHPGNALFGKFYSVITDLFQSLGIQPTFIGAEGEGYSGKFAKFSGKTRTKLLESDFSGISVLSLAANPSTSDSPAYDSFAMASLSHVDADQELVLSLVVNEAFVKLRSEPCDAIVNGLARFHDWDFGFGFSANAADQPELHILGMDNGRLSKEDQRLLNAWYAALADVRVRRLRDVYPYNLLNEQQLYQEITTEKCLKDFIEQQPGCTLTRLTDYGLYQWKLSDDTTLGQLRKQLRGLPIMV